MTSSFAFYSWKNFRCAYQVHPPSVSPSNDLALLLLHPIGVGLSSWFWERFIQAWLQKGQPYPVYNPDLLGCGESDMPRIAYHPADWAEQLEFFIQTVVKKPVVLIVQGALFPVAIALLQRPSASNWVQGMILSGPPSGPVMTHPGKAWQKRLVWNLLFDGPIGQAFYRYARRRQFLQSFSVRQLFAEAEKVDESWLSALQAGASNLNSRYAVFSFLAGFWRENYQSAIAAISVRTLVIVGNKASTISRSNIAETPEQRLAFYLDLLPNAQGKQIPGRNVLPYEATSEFTDLVTKFLS